MEKQRLDRFISNQTGVSRSVVKTNIRRGWAWVNGERERDPSKQVNAESDEIKYHGAGDGDL